MAVTTKDDEEVQKDALDKVTEALQTLVDAEAIDLKVLQTLDTMIGGLNENTQRAILDLEVMQRLFERAAETDKSDAKPGSLVGSGLAAFKKPYSMNDVYAVWGVEDRYVYNKLAINEMPVVTPGGWQFILRDGVIYDIPRGTPAEKIPENHGYQLPKIVVQILEDSREQRRLMKRDTEQGKPFGMGVRYLQSGWAGKDLAIADGFKGEPVSEE